MSLSTTMMAADLAFIMADFPQTMIFNGASYSVAFTDLASADALQMAGVDPSNEVSAVVLKSDFKTMPVAGDEVTLGGKVLRVISVADGADTICATLTLAGDND